MKLYLHYEVAEGEKTTTKLTVPKSWYSKTVYSVIQLFVESYNKKHADGPLVDSEVHLNNSEGEKIYSDSIISEVLSEHGDYFIKLGEYIKKKNNVDNTAHSKLSKCKNYGCNQLYSEDNNLEGMCCHHTGPPVFHDTIKFWSCCKDRKAYDWEDFQLITGCSVGKHTEIDPKIALGSIRSAPAVLDETPAPVVVKSIADYNKENPDAATAAQSAVKTIAPAERKSTRNVVDGTAKCKNKGCQAVFKYGENHAKACQFHAGQAVFHDTLKFWSCCDSKKCYEFDDFMAVPGCAVGFHDDGVIELPPDHGQNKQTA